MLPDDLFELIFLRMLGGKREVYLVLFLSPSASLLESWLVLCDACLFSLSFESAIPILLLSGSEASQISMGNAAEDAVVEKEAGRALRACSLQSRAMALSSCVTVSFVLCSFLVTLSFARPPLPIRWDCRGRQIWLRFLSRRGESAVGAVRDQLVDVRNKTKDRISSEV